MIGIHDNICFPVLSWAKTSAMYHVNGNINWENSDKPPCQEVRGSLARQDDSNILHFLYHI